MQVTITDPNASNRDGGADSHPDQDQPPHPPVGAASCESAEVSQQRGHPGSRLQGRKRAKPYLGAEPGQKGLPDAHALSGPLQGLVGRGQQARRMEDGRSSSRNASGDRR